MSQSSWWTICCRNATDDPPDGSCPECRHASLMHPGIRNPGLKACVACALDHVKKRHRAITFWMLSAYAEEDA